MGFGHRVYKNYDPRARIIKQIAYEVFEVTGRDPLLDIALELERIALEDEYFIKRKLYPNVDFYSRDHLPGDALPRRHVPRAVRHPAHLGLARAVGRMLEDPEQKIARPRQIYLGQRTRDYVPMGKRDGGHAAVGQAAGS